MEIDGKSLIFYGLGNFLHPGTAEMTRFGLCRDYGLMAKVHLAPHRRGLARRGDRGDPARQYPNQARALRGEEAENSHLCAQPSLRRSRRRAKGAKGVRFTPQSDGSGLYCADGAATLGGKIGTLCQNWLPAAEPDKPIAEKLADACQDKPFYGRPATAKRRAPPRRKDAATPRRSPSAASASSRMRRQPRRRASSSYRLTLRTMTGVTGSPGQVGAMTRFSDLAPTSRATRRRWPW